MAGANGNAADCGLRIAERVCCLSLILCVLGINSVGADTPNYLLLLSEGAERIAAGDGEAARGLLEAAARADPQDPLSYLGRGWAALAGGDVPGAAPFFRRAAAFENAPAGAAYGLGLCYLLTGHAESAHEYFQAALERDPDLASAQTCLALLETLAGEYDRAQEYLQQARAGGGARALLEYVQILLDYQQGAWERVIAALQVQLERDTETGLMANGQWLMADDRPSAINHQPSTLPLRLSFTEASELQLALVPSAPPPEDLAPLAEPPPPPAPPPPPSDRPYFQGLAPGQVVRGMQSLRVRMPAGVEPDFVAFSVDGQCVSVTNTRPYGFRWDTTREAEGPHTLTIQTEGRAALEYLLEVIVQNREPEPEPGYDPAAWQDLAQRLSRPLKVSLPGYDAEQMLLHAYLRSGQPEEARRMCEAILARSWQRREVLPLLLQLYARAGRSRPVEEVGQPHSGVPGGQWVALTFDDGPNIPQTGQLLKLLDEYGARATFLVVGRRAEQYPYLLREIAAHGHEIGSHSYSHRRMLGLSEEEVLLEVLRTELIVRQAGPQPVRFFRPPGGHSTPQVRAALAKLGYTLIFWTINGGSYKYLPPAEAARRMMERTTDGTIFLLHNGPDNTLELLPELLRQLQTRGFRCVTVSEILQPPAPETADLRLPSAD